MQILSFPMLSSIFFFHVFSYPVISSQYLKEILKLFQHKLRFFIKDFFTSKSEDNIPKWQIDSKIFPAGEDEISIFHPKESLIRVSELAHLP